MLALDSAVGFAIRGELERAIGANLSPRIEAGGRRERRLQLDRAAGQWLAVGKGNGPFKG